MKWGQLQMKWSNLELISQRVNELKKNTLKNSYSSSLDSCATIRSKFCTCHDSLAVVTCAKLWPDSGWLDISFHVRITNIFMRLGLSAHKFFVKWVSGTVAYMCISLLERVIVSMVGTLKYQIIILVQIKVQDGMMQQKQLDLQCRIR